MKVRWARVVAVTAMVLAFVVGAGTGPAGAEGVGGVHVGGTNDGESATGAVEVDLPGELTPPNGDGGDGGTNEPSGPNCTRSDGTPDYLNYKGLQWTTMEQQRNDIRPEEQRPGYYAHVYCGTEYMDFQFFPEDEDGGGGIAIDPATLARSVTITPAAPVIVTSPDTGNHLVGIEAWFWVESWDGVEGSTAAGPVEVTVSAEPTTLVIDPGDGSPAFTCQGPPPAYDTSRSSSAQSSDCTHTYDRAGVYEASATLTYDLSFTSNVGVSGDLGTIEPSSTSSLTVNEAQAIVTR